jgi:hypothetical protein
VPWSIVPFLPGRPAAQNPPTDLRDAAVSLVYLANSADNALIASIGQRTLSAVLA